MPEHAITHFIADLVRGVLPEGSLLVPLQALRLPLWALMRRSGLLGFATWALRFATMGS